MTTLDDLRDAFAHLADDGPEPALDPAALVAVPAADRSTRTRRRFAVALVSAAVVAAVVSVVVVVQQDRPATVGPIAPTPTTSLAPDANREAAEREAERLLAEAGQPAGAVESDTAPWPALDQDVQPGFNTVERHRWWTAPTTLAAAVDTVRTAVRDGATLTVLGDALGRDVTRMQIRLAAVRGAPGYGIPPSVDVDLEARGDIVGAFVQAVVPWAPVPTSGPLVPPPAAGAEVVTARSGHPTLHHTLSPDQTVELVDFVNAQPEASVAASCPIGLEGAVSDTIGVDTADGVFTVGVVVTGCRTIDVTAPNGYTTVLVSGGALHEQIADLVDLPAEYR